MANETRGANRLGISEKVRFPFPSSLSGMQRRQSAHLSESHVPRMETKEGKAERELRPGTGLTPPGYRGKWGVFLSLR